MVKDHNFLLESSHFRHLIQSKKHYEKLKARLKVDGPELKLAIDEILKLNPKGLLLPGSEELRQLQMMR